MAPSLRRRCLVCFYCNKKSNIKYDGVIAQWDCGHCESTNYLDENGDITDPPVATEQEARNELQYTIPRSESPLLQSSESSLFCPTCIKNQHLYNASLSQYHVELDPNHEDYRDSEKKYYKFRKDLERRYPQVCEDCHPRVLERMREAGKTARADYLRRLMDKSRARKLQPGSKISLYGLVLLLGRLLWYMGIAGQLSWNLLGLVASSPLNLQQTPQMSSLNSYMAALVYIKASAIVAPLIRVGLICSLLSLWWNPMFRQMNRGFMNHIKGIGNWYKLQAILLLARGLFFSVMGAGVLADPSSSATRGAHIFMLAFVVMVAVKSRRSLTVNMTPLWSSTPEKFPHVGPRSQSPVQPGYSMEDALHQITVTPSRAQRPPSPPSPSAYSTKCESSLSPIRYSQTRRLLGRPIQQSGAIRTAMKPDSIQLLSLEDTSAMLVPQQRLTEEMEWSPTQQPASKHRAFDPSRSLLRDSQHFGQAPVAEQPSPFWFKVPPAPITPAQRLRNPLNQPKLRVSSSEAKQNFFNSITRPEVNLSDAVPKLVRPGARLTSRNQNSFLHRHPPPSLGIISSIFSDRSHCRTRKRQELPTKAPGCCTLDKEPCFY